MSNGLMEQLGLCVKNHSHQLILRKASQLDIAFFDTSSFYDEMDRAIRDGYRATSLAMLSVGIIASAVSLIAILGLLVRVHWAAPLVILVTAIPQVVIGGYYASQRFSIVGNLTRNRRVSDYLSRLLSSRESIKEIRIFGLHNELLTRFYDPTEGIVFLDGKDLRDYDPKELHRQIGVIFQDFVRYDLSAKENIGFGQVEFLEDIEKIHDAAEKGGSSEIIRKLPEGFNTILGKTFDEGVDLSGGEWQKLALSRAFMRHAQILVLDEPTAALDAFAEYEIHKRFVDLTSDKTTIFISHRFSTVRMAQHILVLQNGKLVEEGSHGDLMNLNGLYTNMFNTQADRYR